MGSLTSSLTPALIAWSINVGSSVVAAITIPVDGCCRRIAASAGGIRLSVRRSSTITSGCCADAPVRLASACASSVAIFMPAARRISSSCLSTDPTSATFNATDEPLLPLFALPDQRQNHVQGGALSRCAAAAHSARCRDEITAKIVRVGDAGGIRTGARLQHEYSRNILDARILRTRRRHRVDL